MVSVQRPTLSHAHLNLRHNPFGELDRARRAELAVADVGPFVERLRRPGYAVQFLGQPGRGKTTHLLAIGRCFDSAGYVRIEENESPILPRRTPLLIDEAQRLPQAMRRILFQSAASFALASHRDLSAELRRAGLAVQTVRLGEQLPVEHLCAMLNRRIEAARRDAGEIPRVTLATARALIDRHGTDIRAIENQLYDQFQHLSEMPDA